MKRLANGTAPEEVGTAIELTGSELAELAERIGSADEADHLADFGCADYGNLAWMEEHEARSRGLPPGTAAVVLWCTKTHRSEPVEQARALSAAQAAMLVDTNEQAAVAAVDRFYREVGDDAHPAYRLHRIREARRNAGPARGGA